MAIVKWGEGHIRTLTIPNGQMESDVLNLQSLGRRSAFNIMVYSPATLTGTITVAVAPYPNSPIGEFRTLQSGGVDVNPQTGKALVLDAVIAGGLKIVSSLAEGGDRDFVLQAEPRA